MRPKLIVLAQMDALGVGYVKETVNNNTTSKKKPCVMEDPS
jgi:hypothetical protein